MAKTKRKPDRYKRRFRKPEAVVLIGFMGAGKSSVGRVLGEMLSWPFEDLDDRIERREGRTVAEIFADLGESEFRRAEHEALKDLFSELQKGAGRIVALGGGAFVRENNARLLKAERIRTVFLDAGVNELWNRCREQAERQGIHRPLLSNVEDFTKLYQARRPHYLKAALRQETGGKSVVQIATELLEALGLTPQPTDRAGKDAARTGRSQ